MSGSGGSNFGYSNVYPYNTSSYVNGTSSNYSGSFSSNEIPGTPPGPLPGLAGAKINIDAASGNVPGFKGGAKKLKQKIKNITKQYKRMKAGSKKIRSMKKKLRSKTLSKHNGGKRRRHKRTYRKKQCGGYAQYQNNQPLTPTYQVAGINLSANQSALANPAPFKVLPSCTNCVDNYNHYPPGIGFPSKGH
jgi:hypothetical protein